MHHHAGGIACKTRVLASLSTCDTTTEAISTYNSSRFEQVIQFSADFEQVVQCRRLKPLAEPLGCTAMFIRHAIALVVHHHMAVVTPDHVLHPTTIIQPPQT